MKLKKIINLLTILILLPCTNLESRGGGFGAGFAGGMFGGMMGGAMMNAGSRQQRTFIVVNGNDAESAEVIKPKQKKQKKQKGQRKQRKQNDDDNMEDNN